MKNKGLVVTIVITLLLSFQVIVPNVSAHTGGTFTIILSKNGVQPYNVQMLVNDTARWINVDDTENITHQILVDADSDGIFDDEGWNSGTLTNSCEHVNGTKVDEECNAYFEIIFNETSLNMSYDDIVGKYAFKDLTFNETSGNTTIIYGNVTVYSDKHITTGFQDTETDNKNEEGQEERSPVLLIIAIISAVSAIGLGIMIVFGKKDE
ncbi:MAG: hypothetical protein CXT75_04530 [Methanobacteriota archaeon]|jgi:hypothetical protein|nr:MAG: hypothetical protein CXT75_04530 [Euryarchaeota archaeon]